MWVSLLTCLSWAGGGIVVLLFSFFVLAMFVLALGQPCIDFIQLIDKYQGKRSSTGIPLFKYGLRFWAIVVTFIFCTIGYLQELFFLLLIGIVLLVLLVIPMMANGFVIMFRAIQIIYCRKLRIVYNPLLQIYNRHASAGTTDFSWTNSRIFKRYSWAVPTLEALRLIASHGPLLEVGAGTGYWAWLLRQIGVDIRPYDWAPGLSLVNYYHKFKFSWVWVRRADAAKSIETNPGRTLFFCWPSSNHMSSRALERFMGDTVIYIGANSNGNWTRGLVKTGDDAFHQTLNTKWLLIQELKIPAWGDLDDAVRVYRRRVQG